MERHNMASTRAFPITRSVNFPLLFYTRKLVNWYNEGMCGKVSPYGLPKKEVDALERELRRTLKGVRGAYQYTR